MLVTDDPELQYFSAVNFVINILILMKILIMIIKKILIIKKLR